MAIDMNAKPETLPVQTNRILSYVNACETLLVVTAEGQDGVCLDPTHSRVLNTEIWLRPREARQLAQALLAAADRSEEEVREDAQS